MTWALLVLSITILGSLTTCLLVVRSAHKSKDAATDLAMAEQRQRIEAQDDLRLAEANVKVLTDQLELYKERLAAAEKQRNEAMSNARDQLVERIRGANVADAARLVTDLLNVDLRTGMLPQRRLSDDPKDGLLDPSKS